MVIINSLREAIPIVSKLIEKNTQDKITSVTLVNKNRHAVIKTERGLIYWMLFKRAYFMSFGRIFGFSGIGDSINAEELGKALNQNVSGVIFIYKNGYVYYISPQEIFNYGQKFDTIRTTEATGERTYSFPLKVERRWK